ncbi:hypothetical protein GmHk_14G041318 [Glycine max]|nr:hypothetical protein GmHk_14G041318 [Glycine max]
MKLTRNKHRITFTSRKTTKVRPGFILNRNRETSWKIPLRLKGSSRCGVSTENNGGSWWLLVAVGDGEESWHVGNGFGRKKEKQMAFSQSYLDYKAQNTQVTNALGNRNFAHTPDVFSKIPTICRDQSLKQEPKASWYGKLNPLLDLPCSYLISPTGNLVPLDLEIEATLQRNRTERRWKLLQDKTSRSEKVVDEGLEVRYPGVPSKKEKDRHLEKFLDIFRKLEITMPFGEALQQMPLYSKFLKDMLIRKALKSVVFHFSLSQSAGLASVH